MKNAPARLTREKIYFIIEAIAEGAVRMNFRIAEVESGSVAEEVGIRAGEYLLAIDGRPIADLVDYACAQRRKRLSLVIRDSAGEIVQYDIAKTEQETLGLRFGKEILKPRVCENQCAFCMAAQLPHDANKELFPRYDDWRRSFLYGEWATFSNLTRRDLERIAALQAGPLYVAVHATDPEVRASMLGNEDAGEIMPLLEMLAQRNVDFYASVTICPDINDGFILRKTFEDMLVLFPHCKGLCISPVRLTYHRRGLTRLKRVEQQTAAYILDELARWQEKCFEMKGVHFIYATDEFYSVAGKEIPKKEVYDDYPLYEQGVGRLSKMNFEIEQCMEELPPWILDREVSLICGVQLVPYLNKSIGILQERYANLTVHVYGIRNFFFGESVVSTRMLTGKDIAVQLDGKRLGSEVIIFDNMLPDGEHFMDDLSVDDLSQWINKPVHPVNPSGKSFACAVLGLEQTEI